MSAPIPSRDEAQLRLIEVNRRISRWRHAWLHERLALYRQHLQVSVTEVSPLLPLIAKAQQVDVRATMWRLKPPFGWPEHDVRRREKGTLLTIGSHLRRDRSFSRFDPARTIVVRDRNDPIGILLLRVTDTAVELTMQIGDVTIRTDGGLLQLFLPFDLPETVKAAVLGRPVGFLVGHACFSDRRWLIRKVEPHGKCTRLAVQTGQIPFTMPWGRMIEAIEPTSELEQPTSTPGGIAW